MGHEEAVWSIVVWLLIASLGVIGTLIGYIWHKHNQDSKDRKEAFDEVLKGLKESLDGLKDSLDGLGKDVFKEIGKLYSKTAALESGLAEICAHCKERGQNCPGRNPEFLKYIAAEHLNGNTRTD